MKKVFGIFTLAVPCLALIAWIVVQHDAAEARVPTPTPPETPVAAQSPTLPRLPQLEPRRRHHVICYDQSLSVRAYHSAMKGLVRSYARKFIKRRDQVTLFAFAFDDRGSAKKLLTFDYTDQGEQVLDRQLDDLKNQVKVRHSTLTLFKPLADELNGFLAEIVDAPSVLVISDGLSDGKMAKIRGLIDYEDVPFSAFGRRYAIPQTRGWWVAISGSQGVDFSTLFSTEPKSITPPALSALSQRKQAPEEPPPPALRPCMLEPRVYLSPPDKQHAPGARQTAGPVTLVPAFWPSFSGPPRKASVEVKVWGECVARRRTLHLYLGARGADGVSREVALAPVEIVLGKVPETIAVPLEFALEGAPEEKLPIRVVLDLGEGLTRTVGSFDVQVVRQQWSSVHGPTLGLGGGLSLFGLVALGGVVVAARRKERRRPEIVKVAGGTAASLRRGVSLRLGGPSCELRVPGAEDRDVVATLAWAGQERGRYRLEPEPSWSLMVNNVPGGEVRPGDSVEAIRQDGRKLLFVIDSATSRDLANLGVGPADPARNILSADPFGGDGLAF